jgi:3-methyladenine DNA glycosylase AlkC
MLVPTPNSLIVLSLTEMENKPYKRKFIMPEPLKNLLNKELISELAGRFKKADPKFDAPKFIRAVFDSNWENRELKSRINHVANCMQSALPYAYPKQVQLVRTGGKEFRGLAALIFPEFVQIFGLEHPEISLDALEELTQYSTAEFAIRPYIEKHYDLSMKRIKQWAKQENEHVRRLASEGIRPRLPWAPALPQFKKNPKPVLEVLELLKNDSSEYVRRSVANNLNDIAKDHPELVIKTAGNWYGKNENTNRLIKHACRTLLKEGNAEALRVFGLTKGGKASVSKLKLAAKQIPIGNKLNFHFDLHNEMKKPQELRIEYAVYFMKSNGAHSRKVFQLTTKSFSPGITKIQKTHPFTDFSTRKHYPGLHWIAISVNGTEKAKAKLTLE